MKRKYSLDHSIERDVDRMEAVREILDTLDFNPSPRELEQMASYVLYGKDENGKNAVQRGETTDANKRYNSFVNIEEKHQSLDALLENPMADQQNMRNLNEKYIYTKKKPTIAKPKYDRNGALIDPGDSEIPGMQELWDAIARIEHIVAVNEGKIPPDEDTPLLPDPYRLYQLKHQLIDMRRHQYYIKDAYRPTIHFLNLQPPRQQFINWDEENYHWITEEEWRNKLARCYLSSVSRNLEDYETKIDEYGVLRIKWVIRQQKFDWENPKHVRGLLENYSNLYMDLWDKLDTWGRTLLWDFDHYVEISNFSPARLHIILRKIDRAQYSTITAELQQKFGLCYNENHLSTIIAREIPEKIAQSAKKERLLHETPQEECKQCFRCKKYLPRNTLFFGINHSRSDGFASNCKECERLRRIHKGGQTEYDRRRKDTSMLEVSPKTS